MAAPSIDNLIVPYQLYHNHALFSTALQKKSLQPAVGDNSSDRSFEEAGTVSRQSGRYRMGNISLRSPYKNAST